MKTKTVLKYLLVRISVLILAFLTVFAIWYFTFDKHQRCDGDEHRHVDGGLGLFIGFFMITFWWFAVLLFEGIIYFIKGKNELGIIALIVLFLLGILGLAFI
jgi:hypothetical protein